MKKTFTVVTCHFGDLFWIRLFMSRLNEFTTGGVEQVVVVDQSRTSKEALESIPGVGQVLTFPEDLSQVKLLGHDHPAALDAALRQVDFSTSHVLVMDSDCFPIASTWTSKLDAPAVVARDPAKWGLSHPCLMSIPTNLLNAVNFSEGLHEVQLDTGRLVGLQLARRGVEVAFTDAVAAFGKWRGHFYLDQSVYHHGSASFGSSSSSRVRSKSDPWKDAFFQRKVARADWHLGALDRARLRTHAMARRLRTQP